jgi:hypothetical protein
MIFWRVFLYCLVWLAGISVVLYGVVYFIHQLDLIQ